MAKTKREVLAEELASTYDRMSTELLDELDAQGKKVAANMLFGAVGQDPRGHIVPAEFIYGICSAHDLALTWAVQQGYVEFTDKALASEEELQEREQKKLEKRDTQALRAGMPQAPSAYL